MLCSLVYIEPKGIKVIPSKLNLDIFQLEFNGLDSCSTSISLEDLFMKSLVSIKLYGYFINKYTEEIDRLFREIMNQNLKVQYMRWYFDCSNFPYTIQISRDDLCMKCATTYTCGYNHYSVYYYTMDVHGSIHIDKEKILGAWREKKYINVTNPVSEMSLNFGINKINFNLIN